MIAAASQPNHYRQRAARRLARPPYVDEEAIFLAPDVLPDDLRAHGAVTAAVTHALPGLGCLGWLPAQRTNRRSRIGNTLEGQHLAFGHPANRTLLGTRDVGTAFSAGRRQRRWDRAHASAKKENGRDHQYCFHYCMN